MLIIPEFLEFLKHAKTNLLEIYKEITEVRSPWRAEWFDAVFLYGKGGEDLCVSYNYILNSEKKLTPRNLEVLDEDTLMKDRQISLEDYLFNHHTSQGFPSKKVEIWKSKLFASKRQFCCWVL